MSLKVSIGQGTRGVIVEKDRKKEKKERRSRSERDLREVISREVRGTGDLRDRLEEVRGAIREEEQRAAGRDTSETCEMPICNSESKLTVYSDEKSPDSKGKENSKEENAKEKVKEGKEKTLTSEWGQRKKKKKKRSKSRSKERKPLADKDSENRKRKHSVEPETKDGIKSKKEKRKRSTSRDEEEKKRKKEKKKEKKQQSREQSRDVRIKKRSKSREVRVKRSKSREIKKRSKSQEMKRRSYSREVRRRSPSREERRRSRSRGSSGRKESSGRKSRIDSGISTLTNGSKDSVSPRNVGSPRRDVSEGKVFSPRKLKLSPPKIKSHSSRVEDEDDRGVSLSPSPSPPRRILERQETPERRQHSLLEMEEIKKDLGMTDGFEKDKIESHSDKAFAENTPDVNNTTASPQKENKDAVEEEGFSEEKKQSDENEVKDESKERDSKERKSSGDKRDSKEKKRSRSRDKRTSLDRSAGRSRRSRSREGRNPYSVYDEKHGRREVRRRRTRSRERPSDLKEEVDRLRRDRARRSRSHSRPRGSRRLSDDHYRRREGRGGRRRRYSGELERGEPSSWEDKVESFLQGTNAHANLSAVPLLPQDFDPSKPPPMAASVVPPDYALTDYADPLQVVPEVSGPPVRQLTDVSTGQIIPQPGTSMPPAQQPAQQEFSVPPPVTYDYPPPTTLPPPHYVQTEVTSFAKEPQPSAEVQYHQQQQQQQVNTEAMELAAMNQLHEENLKNKKDSEKPLTVKEKKKAEKAGRELWQFVAKMLITDSVFCSKAKKKKAKSSEELKEKAEKCAVRIAITLEKAGFSELRLWKMMKDNEKGVQGFSTELASNVQNGTIEADPEARSPKHRLDAELLRDGAVFRYIGQYIQGNPAASGRKSTTPPESVERLPSSSELQSILQATQASELHGPALPRPEELDPMQKAQHENDYDYATRSFVPLEAFFTTQHVSQPVAAAYCLTLVRAGFNYPRLRETCTNFQPPEPLNEGEPPETLYGHLLGCLREISFERYPSIITDGIDHHTVTIVKLVLDHFSKRPAPTSPVLPVVKAPELDVPPPGANTGAQLPRKKYITMAVSVETIPVDGRLAVWQICLHTPGLPEDQDPDYECLMVPNGVSEGKLAEAGFMYNQEKGSWYHQGTEFGRRKAEPEDRSVEKMVNFLEELRGGGREAGLNNGLVLLFECTEDFGLIRSLLSSHSADIWSDTVRGVGCIDHFVRSADIQASYCPPYWKYAVGEEGQWVTTLYRRGKVLKIEAASRGEMVYNILEDVLDKCPTYDTFLRWYCYPSLSDTVTSLARDLEMIKQMLPLQTHVDRQLFNARVQCVLEGVYAPRSELETRQPCACVARQAVRRLVSLGFNLDNLKNSFRADPNYEIPANVFLQDMTQVQRLKVHTQTDFVRRFIKEYFTPNVNKF